MDPAICRQKASRYMGLAQDASDESRRLGLAAVAARWRRLAEHAECPPDDDDEPRVLP
jgi:hypothetical protein